MSDRGRPEEGRPLFVSTDSPGAIPKARAKTHGRWRVRRTDDGAMEWTSPHGFVFRVDRLGTHRITNQDEEQSEGEDEDGTGTNVS